MFLYRYIKYNLQFFFRCPQTQVCLDSRTMQSTLMMTLHPAVQSARYIYIYFGENYIYMKSISISSISILTVNVTWMYT